MFAGRLANLLRRQRLFLAAVLVAALAGSVLWDAFGPGDYIAEAEILVAAKIPSQSQLGQYDVELSRASTTDFLVDDLGRVVEGNAFAGLVAERFQELTGASLAAETLMNAVSTDRSHRGLKLILRWPDKQALEQLIGLAATALAEDAGRFYPSIHEVADLSIINLSQTPRRPSVLVAAFDVTLKVIAAAVVALAIGVWWDIGRGRLYSEDVEELLGVKLLGRVGRS